VFPKLPPLPRISHVPQRACLLKSLGVAAILNRRVASGKWRVAPHWQTPFAGCPDAETDGRCECASPSRSKCRMTSWHRFLRRGDVETWRRGKSCCCAVASGRWAIGRLGNDDTIRYDTMIAPSLPLSLPGIRPGPPSPTSGRPSLEWLGFLRSLPLYSACSSEVPCTPLACLTYCILPRSADRAPDTRSNTNTNTGPTPALPRAECLC
jgi:hypothetical protein